jgi:2-haloacid dehalogenase
MSTIDLADYDALTFDCYGTLIDWEAGLLAALRPILAEHGVADEGRGGPSDEELLEIYGRHEAALEAGEYLRYREVLGSALSGLCAELGVMPEQEEIDRFGGSVADWPAFPDSAEALASLATRYRLGVITNCDDDLFAFSSRKLGDPFTWVITAQQAGSYKPDPHGFELAFRAIDVPRERILHVAQSLFHDHVTAKRLGMASVWIDRRAGRAGSGATPPAEAAPDLTFPDMASFARAAEAAG